MWTPVPRADRPQGIARECLTRQAREVAGEDPMIPTPLAQEVDWRSREGHEERVTTGFLDVITAIRAAGAAPIPDGVDDDETDEESLLPTPAVNDMGEGKTLEEWDEWNSGETMAHQLHGQPLSIVARDLERSKKPTASREAREGGPLLRTPMASDANDASAQGVDRVSSGGIPSFQLREQVGTIGDDDDDDVDLLPTPVASNVDTEHGPNLAGSPNLGIALTEVTDIHISGTHGRRGNKSDPMLPTPKASNNENENGPGDYSPNLALALTEVSDIAVLGRLDRGRPDRPRATTAWGRYEPAIRRWERVTGREAPPPTEMHKGDHRLSPRFVEWMMGLDEGHVAEVPDLSRSQQLKALGNGVVPLQAAAALAHMLILEEDE